MEACKNCGHQNKEEDKFCSNCGQKTVERLKMKTLLGELAAAFLSWDSKLFRTLNLLLFKPGEVSKRYVKGERKGYVAPMRIYLFFSVVFFLSLSFLSTRSDGDGNIVGLQWGQDTLSIPRDTLVLMNEHDRLDELDLVSQQETELERNLMKQLVRLAIDGKGFNEMFTKTLSYLLFLFIPLFALTLRLFYYKKKLDYIEHLVYGLYFHSFFFFMLILSLVVSRWIDDAIPLLLAVILVFLHFLFGSKRFYEVGWGQITLKTIFIILLYGVLATVFTLLAVLLAIMNY